MFPCDILFQRCTGVTIEYRDYFDTDVLVLLDYVDYRSGGVVLWKRRIGMMLLRPRIRLNKDTILQLTSIPMTIALPPEFVVIVSALHFLPAHFFSMAGNSSTPIAIGDKKSYC